MSAASNGVEQINITFHVPSRSLGLGVAEKKKLQVVDFIIVCFIKR